MHIVGVTHASAEQLHFLSDSDQLRYHQMRGQDNLEFLAGRLALKTAYTMIAGVDEAQDMDVVYTDHGAPYLNGQQHHCSISHSSQAAIGGVSRHKIGVDIERIRSRNDALLRYISETDEQAMVSRALGTHVDLITAIWVMKEAVLKAIGVGLSMPPSRVHVQNVRKNGTFEASLSNHIEFSINLFIYKDYAIAIAYEQTTSHVPQIHWYTGAELSAA